MRALKWLGVMVAGLAVIAGAIGWYGLAVPGTPHAGALPAATTEEADLAQRLKRHVSTIASEPHNLHHPAALERAAVYIEQTLAAYGFKAERQVYEVAGKPTRNIFVTIDPKGGAKPSRTIVVGAHYDSWIDTPGANDNATGTAAAMELARLLGNLGSADTRLIVVLFTNEENPYFGTRDWGSRRFAEMLAERGEPVSAMLSLETIGFYSDVPNSQKYPAPLGLFYPTTANFVAFVAMPGSRTLMQKLIGAFRETTAFPTAGGVAPGFIPGIGWSDHKAFADAGFEAVMITDTALFRYAHYHKPTDTPDKVDYDRLARITKGIERAVRKLASP